MDRLSLRLGEMVGAGAWWWLWHVIGEDVGVVAGVGYW